MKELLKIFFLLLYFGIVNPESRAQSDYSDIIHLWNECKLDGTIGIGIFKIALNGLRNIDNLKKRNIITIVDFSKPSSEKRFVVIDLDLRRVLFTCYVAHGKNSGTDLATSFSNRSESLMSSLGFYVTGETYSGKHGYSLRLDGLEKGINDNARSRDLVIHGADYVSEAYIAKYGRLGRSWGCPALPATISKQVIDLISEGSCIFIYADDKFYRENSLFWISE